MAFSKVYAMSLAHPRAQTIAVETDVSRGLHHFSIVGLADRMVDEAKERCSLAIGHGGFRSPRKSNERIVISLAPAHLRKTGTAFDLAISVGYLLASDQLRADVSGAVFVGELSLDGNLKRIRGIIPMLQQAIAKGFVRAYVPAENATEAAALADRIEIHALRTLTEVIALLSGALPGKPLRFLRARKIRTETAQRSSGVTLDQIRGNELAKRALLVALCGGHNLCFVGPPGTGKSILAKSAASLLPDLEFQEQLELSSIYSLSPEYSYAPYVRPPFRAPHHAATYAAMVGGGRDIVPGEISLSHLGILFLDELPEFSQAVLDSLRQPLEDRRIRIARSGRKTDFPCDFQLLGTMNPCPCGYLNTAVRECTCTVAQIQKYAKKVSGPITDRIDMWVEVSKVSYSKLMDSSGGDEQHRKARQLISQTRRLQKKTFSTLSGRLEPGRLSRHIRLDAHTKTYYDEVAGRLRLSARGYVSTLRVALTISMLDNSPIIRKEHLLEALSYRPAGKGAAELSM